jgi:superfamily II DNA or RNA helicase
VSDKRAVLPAPATSEPRFATQDEVLAWLRGEGLLHLSRVSLGVLAPAVDAAFLPQLRSASARRRLTDVASAEAIARWTAEAQPTAKMRELLPGLALRFLEEESAAAQAARAEPRLLPPEEPRTHEVHRLLLQLRAQLAPHVAPRLALSREALQHDPLLPGFRLRESRCSELPLGAQEGFILPEARLAFTPDAIRAQCSCGAMPCVHALAAIDTCLLWLRQPWSPAFGEALRDLVLPGWDRTLRALGRALDDSPRGAPGAEISFEIEVLENYGVMISAAVQPPRAKQRKRVSRQRLLAEYGAQLSVKDARIAALLPDSGPASRALLLELVDHPRVLLEDAHVRIERAPVGLVAEQRGAQVLVSAGVDGTALPAEMLERIRKARPDEPLFLWYESSLLLTVLEASQEVRALLAVLHRHGNAFPPESHGALLERLSQLSARVPVALPRGVMGESVPPQDLPVLRLEAQAPGSVRVELRTRPLADSATFTPGEGQRDVHVRRGTGAVHAVRDLARERAAALALVARLPLGEPETDATAAPFTFLLDTQGALALLAACQQLEDAPPALEWISTPLRLHARRGAGALTVSVERRRDWFGVLGGLAVEGERVELARLLDAARRNERFVRVDANSFVEIESALREQLSRLSDHAHVSRHGLEIGPAAVESMHALQAAGAAVDTDQAWKTLAARIFAARELRPRVPAALKAELRDYQLEGFRWLVRLSSWGAGAVLADDMGLGKTVQALALLLERSKLGPALVLAPTSVGFNWMDEAQRFAPSLRMTLFADSDDRGGALDTLGPRDVLVLSYGLLTRDIERLAKVCFATIVFDEGQQLKNAQTHRFRAARALQGEFKVALSGTPLENNLAELWSLFAVVFPGLLGSHEAFRSRFAAPIERQADPTAAPALARVLQPFLLRRTKAQVEAQLPPRTEVRVPVVLSPEEWTLYEDVRLAALSDLETSRSKLREQERRIQVLAALTRLRLLASHPRLYDPASKVASSKLLRFLELVTELSAEGQRALVFSQFTSHLALVRELLDARGISYEYLDGQTPQGARAARVRAFQEGSAKLFLISLKAGGFGLNLTAATSVIHLDPWWNPAVEDQASDRAHRIGQDRPVTVYRLVARGTIEEKMLALHEDKRALVASVLEGKELAGKLSVHELLGMLSSGAVTPEPAKRSHTRH